MTGPVVVVSSSGSPSLYLGDDVRRHIARGEDIRLQLRLDAADKLHHDVCVHVDALDGAAALSGVEDGAVDETRRDGLYVGVRADVGCVVAAQLEVDGLDVVGGCFAQSDTAGRGAGERHGLDVWELGDLVESVQAGDVDDLEDMLW